MTSWQQISTILKEDETDYFIIALKTLVGDVEDLSLVDFDDLKIIANRGFLTKRTKSVLFFTQIKTFVIVL